MTEFVRGELVETMSEIYLISASLAHPIRIKQENFPKRVI